MTPRDALAEVEAWLSNTSAYGARTPAPVVEAIAALAAWARDQLPPPPYAVIGRTVEHAAKVVHGQYGDELVALCGGLKPEPVPADDAGHFHLPTFDPSDPEACKRCTRELPADLRPPSPPAGRRQRPPLDLSAIEVNAGVVDDEYAVIVCDDGGMVAPMAVYSVGVDLATLLAETRERLRLRDRPTGVPHP